MNTIGLSVWIERASDSDDVSPARTVNLAWRFQAFWRTAAHDHARQSSVRANFREAGTTTNRGALRLWAPFEFPEDHCVGRSLAVNEKHEITSETLLETTCVATQASRWRCALLNTGPAGTRGVADAPEVGANPVTKRNRR